MFEKMVANEFLFALAALVAPNPCSDSRCPRTPKYPDIFIGSFQFTEMTHKLFLIVLVVALLALVSEAKPMPVHKQGDGWEVSVAKNRDQSLISK